MAFTSTQLTVRVFSAEITRKNCTYSYESQKKPKTTWFISYRFFYI